MTNPTQDQFDADVRRYVELEAAKADIQVELETIKERLRQRGEGKHTAPCGVRVTVSPNRRFNPQLAADIVPAELIPAIQTTSIDSKKAKAVLPPAMYEQAMAEVGEPRVVVK